MGGRRCDAELVARGLAESRSRAQALIRAGSVRLAGVVVERVSTPVPEGAALSVEDAGPGWVSRGALKLVAALDHFGLTPAGEALDLGASTGGFTEVLLARGVRLVHALDVGHGQMHPRLVADPRVRVIEGVNARAIPPGLVPPVDWVVADLSFIGLAKALPGAMALARPGACLVALVKPQFEVGPEAVARGGIVRDPVARAAALAGVRGFLEREGWAVLGAMDSPITGGDGNHEYLIAARKPGGGVA